MTSGAPMPRKMYHYARSQDIDSIQERGLLTRHPDGSSLAERDGEPAGVYMFHDRRQAEMLDDGGVFEVDTSGLTLHNDPFHDPGVAAYSPHDIPVSKIQFAGHTLDRRA